ITLEPLAALHLCKAASGHRHGGRTMTQVCHQPQSEVQPLKLPRPTPFISVVVPVRNEASCIRRTLEQILDQNYDSRRFEILVADGRSTDDTAEIVREVSLNHPQVRLLDNPGRLASSGRNRGIRFSQGEIILIIDGHCDLKDPDYLAKI